MSAPADPMRSPPPGLPAPRAGKSKKRRERWSWRACVLTALAYAAVGFLALSLAGPGGYVSPLYPSAGIALAAALIWGRSALPGVLVGALLVNLHLGLQRPEAQLLQLLLVPLCLGVGAAAQAWLGSWLLRRYTRQPTLLDSPRDIALAALLGAGLASTVSASVATPMLVLGGLLPVADAAANWLTWWTGDALGALIGAPVMLTLMGQPRAEWQPRRLTVGLPLTLALLLVGASLLELEHREQQRLRANFERDVDRLANDAAARLQVPLYALQALHGVARAQASLDEHALRSAARWWLQQPGQLQAMGYSVRVPRLDIERFEAAVRADGLPQYTVFQRDDDSALDRDDEVLAVRLIEPRAGNEGALGVNTLSIPQARVAALQARRSGEPAATAGFKLTQSAAQDSQEVGVVLYQALYEGEPASDLERDVRFRGVVFVTLRAETLLRSLGSKDQLRLPWCLVDPAADAVQARIAGSPSCEQRPQVAGQYQTVRVLDLGGRKLELRVDSPSSPLHPWKDGTLLFSLVATSAVAMLGALLLIVTGQSRRTERAVRAATADLRREMAERTLTQQALADSEERLRSILNHLPIGVMFLDARGRMLECNPRLCEMFGEPVEQLRGLSLKDLLHPQERTQPLPVRLGGNDDESAGSEELLRPLRLLRSDGRTVWVQVSTTALRDAADGVGRRVGVVQDVTEHLRLRESERALQEAEASNRAKSEFVSRMSHELRTPLNAMIGFAQLLSLDKEPGLDAHQREWAQQIQRAGWHLLEMINETLDLARIESGAVQLLSEPVALAALVQGAQALVSAQAEQRGIVIEHSFAADAPAVLGDPTRLKQVLTNLLSNAVKYNVDKGKVWVSSRTAADGVVAIAVTDTGIGMTPEQLGALFQPYNRLGREGSGIEGTGIGLVISRRLVDLMGGTLEARSVAGKGSTFTLRLPSASPAAEPTPAPTATASAPYQLRRVHYVEDNATNVEVMRGVLLQRPQVRLAVSTSGLDGMQRMRAEKPDLILLDMQLPDISGLELLRHVKEDPTLTTVPVIVVSADATAAKMTEALRLGALNYVTKPLDVQRFLAVLDEALENMETRWG